MLLLGRLASSLLNIPLGWPHLLLTIRRMEIDSADGALYLIEANIVESLEARTVDLSYAMIWHQEFLLPAHEHVFAVCAVLVMEIGLLGLLCERSPSLKASPVLHVLLVTSAPVLVPGLEGIFWTNNLTLKESGECSVFGCEAYDYYLVELLG